MGHVNLDNLSEREILVHIFAKMTGIETHMSGIETKITGLEDHMSGLEDRMSGLEGHMSGLEDRISVLDTRFSELDSKVSGIEQNVQELVEDMKWVKPILQETNSAVAVGFMEQRNLLSTVKEVAVDQDEQIAQVELLGDKAEMQERTSLRIRQRMNLLERRVEFLEQHIVHEP